MAAVLPPAVSTYTRLVLAVGDDGRPRVDVQPASSVRTATSAHAAHHIGIEHVSTASRVYTARYVASLNLSSSRLLVGLPEHPHITPSASGQETRDRDTALPASLTSTLATKTHVCLGTDGDPSSAGSPLKFDELVTVPAVRRVEFVHDVDVFLEQPATTTTMAEQLPAAHAALKNACELLSGPSETVDAPTVATNSKQVHARVRTPPMVCDKCGAALFTEQQRCVHCMLADVVAITQQKDALAIRQFTRNANLRPTATLSPTVTPTCSCCSMYARLIMNAHDCALVLF